MEIKFFDDRVIVSGTDDFSAGKIFDCGQCFRWVRSPDGSWTGSALGRVLRLREEEGSVIFECGKEEFLGVWHDYFDLGRDYAALRKRLSVSEYMERACGFGAGIRILRQDAWEALCTFIISQCNNIARITGIVDRLCRIFGDEQEGGFCSFPGPERLCGLSERDLEPLRAGYRASYIISAARSVASGALELEALRSCDAETAEAALTALPGVGRKVASCVMLFGLGHTEAFPVDTWMRRALRDNFGPGFDPSVFGPDAGFAQQYIFYYSRWGRGGERYVCD
ncbi:MAG: DNA-3-methyladenine glycosylase 2 family protein [Clostridiales bacterium]|jgi:N-glycosylase/DNA lyase|nr:DNA-3-methyladenine glycosylase 2 family protein [Clostridiales bacterium]